MRRLATALLGALALVGGRAAQAQRYDDSVVVTSRAVAAVLRADSLAWAATGLSAAGRDSLLQLRTRAMQTRLSPAHGELAEATVALREMRNRCVQFAGQAARARDQANKQVPIGDSTAWRRWRATNDSLVAAGERNDTAGFRRLRATLADLKRGELEPADYASYYASIGDKACPPVPVPSSIADGLDAQLALTRDSVRLRQVDRAFDVAFQTAIGRDPEYTATVRDRIRAFFLSTVVFGAELGDFVKEAEVRVLSGLRREEWVNRVLGWP
ncbi:MAG: hypothetical protein SFW08_02950 [Gemmatimonadaceae bacterium]|nr:hypothetical protein [Gemmatimonadaceae bacterium]